MKKILLALALGILACNTSTAQVSNNLPSANPNNGASFNYNGSISPLPIVSTPSVPSVNYNNYDVSTGRNMNYNFSTSQQAALNRVITSTQAMDYMDVSKAVQQAQPVVDPSFVPVNNLKDNFKTNGSDIDYNAINSYLNRGY